MRGWAVAAGLAVGGLLAATAAAETTPLVAQIVLNGSPTGAITEFERDGTALIAPGSALRALGFDVPENEAVDLGSIPGVQYAVDEQSQSVLISVDLLEAVQAQLDPEQVRDARARAGRGRRLRDYGAYAPPPSADPPDLMVAQIILNGEATGAITEVERRQGALLAPSSVLRDLGIVVGPEEVVDLTRTPGLRATIDERSQSVLITASPQAFARQNIDARPAARGPDLASWGALVDYGFYAIAEEGGEAAASASLDFRLFGPPGVFSSAFAARGSTTGDREFRRLGTALTLTDPERARRLVFGDFISAGLSWTRPIRAAGISFATDFEIRPDLVVEPWPEISGTAAAPSTVDLYVNGVRRYSTETTTGPFSISRAPVVDGRGKVTLVVTDELGRQTVQSLQYYGASELLRPGLSAYAIEAGAIRIGFASERDRYENGFVSLAGRRGMSDGLTLEGHAAATNEMREAGVGFVGKIAEAGVAGAAIDFSTSRDGSGARLHLSGRRDAEHYSIYGAVQETFADFLDLPAAAGDPLVRRGVLAGASVFGDRFGTLGVNYNRQERTDGTISILGANWSRSLGARGTLYFNAFASTEDWETNGVTFGLSLPLGENRFGGVEASAASGDLRLAGRVTQAAPIEGGWGWRAAADTGSFNRLEGELRRQGQYGEVGFGASLNDEQAAGRVYGSGSMVWMGGAPRLSARTGDSFALVETGMPGVEVMVENRPAGRTGRDGRLLVEGLPAYSKSRIAVRPESVPLGAVIEGVTAEVRPPKNAGVTVSLPVRTVSAATVRLVMPSGADVPVGSPVRLNGADAGRVGYGGVSFLTDLKAENRLEVTLPTGRCLVEVPHVEPSNDLPEIGPLVCRPG